jgi:SAM-dependent methyltransferase
MLVHPAHASGEHPLPAPARTPAQRGFDDALWTSIGDLIFGPERWAAAPGEVAAILRLLRLAPGASVLDMPCGTGRHSMALAAAGHRVAGVDRCEQYLAEAAVRSRGAGLTVDWVAADMRDFRRAGAFDAVLNLNTSFGYFRDDADNLRVLQNMYASLKDDGQILIDITTRDQLSRSFHPYKVRDIDGVCYEEITRLDHEQGWLSKEVIVARDHERQSLAWGRRIYDTEELASLLAAAGFTDVRCYDGFDGNAYRAGAARLALVATKTTL